METNPVICCRFASSLGVMGVGLSCRRERLTDRKAIMAASLVHGTTLGEAGIDSFSPLARILMRQHVRNETSISHKFVGQFSAISVDSDDNVHETVRLYSMSKIADLVNNIRVEIVNNKFVSFSETLTVNGEVRGNLQNCESANVLNYIITNDKFALENDLIIGYDGWVAKLIDAAEWDELQEEANFLQEMYHDCDAPFPEAAHERRMELANLGADINFGWAPSH